MKTFENYPFWIVAVSNFVSVAIYIIGAYIMYQLGLVWLLLYLCYILVLEFRLMKHCANCYYYGKFCAFGKGKLCSLFFRKGQKSFCSFKLSWKDLIPDLLVALIPLVVGIVLLIKSFSWLILVLLVVLAILTTTGNSFVRGSLACKFCKQRKLGCPAEQLFKKKKR